MDLTALIIFLAIGGVAGWVAGKLMRGGGFGLVGNIVVGIVGAFLGGWLLGMAGLSIAAGLLGTLIKAVIGAIVLLFVVGLLKRA